MHVPVDVADVAQISAAVDRILAAWGVVDILVNCAGIIRVTPFLDVSETEWDQVLDVNLKGTFFFCQTIGRQMASRGRGSIINIASIAGRSGRKDVATYAASKAGVINVTQSAALALAPYQVRVNAICPGVIATAMWEQIDAERAQLEGVAPGEPLKKMGSAIPMGRVGRTDDLVETVAFLAGDGSAYITGQSINVCGGLVMD
jgi:NAD(P)-dependent dehydrogenase (short-subunit alcohol dehydrogenase family)